MSQTFSFPLDMDVMPALRSRIDPDFLPAALWIKEYLRQAEEAKGPEVKFALEREGNAVSRYSTRIIHQPGSEQIDLRHLERILKFLLWQRGGYRIYLAGCDHLVPHLQKIYSEEGERAFDYHFLGKKLFLHPLEISACPHDQLPEESEEAQALGGHTEGYRIGFDLGGSDRKCAAVINGEVVFSAEVEWDPYFCRDPQYHYDGIMDSLREAAAHLPRIDAIGGSAAGAYVNNEVRAGSLFRGVPEDDFAEKVRPLFLKIKKEWGDIPFEIINDGAVTALAGAMSLNANAVLGVAMGTSQAAGYVDTQGRLVGWLDELAFVPIDYRLDAPADEWSGDHGCGVQYFSQQAVGRLAPLAGIELSADMGLPDKLKAVQKLVAEGDERAKEVFRTIGIYFGYGLAHYASFYTIKHLLFLGRVTSGEGGEIILNTAREVLAIEFPHLTDINIVIPDEKMKRHGQAIAAASLAKGR